MGILWMVGAFILVLTPIIIIHELGHFWVAKSFGIEVEEFGVGLPPRAATLFERDGTKYTINWIPLGGFVRPAGEDDPTIPGGLAASSKTARFWTLSAGAIFNFIAAFFVLWFAFLLGAPQFDDTKVAVSQVSANSEAEAIGLQENDIFVMVDGVQIGADFALLQETVGGNLGETIALTIDRDGQLLDLTATPRPSSSDETKGALGVGLANFRLAERASLGVANAARESVSAMWNVVSLTVRAPAMLMSGDLSPSEARPISPVGISQIAGTLAESALVSGDWFNLLYFIGLINVGLGFTNLLPLPALDGGRILFVILEWIRGRRIEPEREGMVHLVGMLLLLSLMLLLIVQDFINPIIPF